MELEGGIRHEAQLRGPRHDSSSGSGEADDLRQPGKRRAGDPAEPCEWAEGGQIAKQCWRAWGSARACISMGGASTTTNGDGTASGAAIDAPVGIDATASDAAASDAAASDAAARNGASASQNGSCSIFRCDATASNAAAMSDAPDRGSSWTCASFGRWNKRRDAAATQKQFAAE